MKPAPRAPPPHASASIRRSPGARRPWSWVITHRSRGAPRHESRATATGSSGGTRRCTTRDRGRSPDIRRDDGRTGVQGFLDADRLAFPDRAGDDDVGSARSGSGTSLRWPGRRTGVLGVDARTGGTRAAAVPGDDGQQVQPLGRVVVGVEQRQPLPGAPVARRRPRGGASTDPEPDRTAYRSRSASRRGGAAMTARPVRRAPSATCARRGR